jgi:N,N-dimethylformamidase
MDNNEIDGNLVPGVDNQQLIDEFRKNPIGHHSPGLQRLLNKMRGASMVDKFCLVTVKPNREWQLAKTSGVPGKPIKLLDKRFSSMYDAEWYVFRQRWKALTGENIK